MLRICVEGAPQGSCDSGFDFGNPDVGLDELLELADSREHKKLAWKKTQNGNLRAKIEGAKSYLIYATNEEDAKELNFFIASQK